MALADLLSEASMPYGEAGRALGEHPNRLRYATTTGTIRIAWDGARQPTIRSVPRPDLDPGDARAELARRYLRALGPGTPEGFGAWAGIKPRTATATFDALAPLLLEVRTPIGPGWILAEDEPALRAKGPIDGSVRLLPSGDVLYLLWGEDRAMLVPDPDLRPLLWAPRVWPGAVVVDGEVVGTWRRAAHRVTVAPWRGLDPSTREKIEAEAASLPLPVVDDVVVGWEP